jgi:hypothetical protein
MRPEWPLKSIHNGGGCIVFFKKLENRTFRRQKKVQWAVVLLTTIQPVDVSRFRRCPPPTFLHTLHHPHGRNAVLILWWLAFLILKKTMYSLTHFMVFSKSYFWVCCGWESDVLSNKKVRALTRKCERHDWVQNGIVCRVHTAFLLLIFLASLNSTFARQRLAFGDFTPTLLKYRENPRNFLRPNELCTPQ